MTVTEDQARAGGCCTCPDPCGGVDITDDQLARGIYGCSITCAWCMHGCPSQGACTCALQPEVM